MARTVDDVYTIGSDVDVDEPVVDGFDQSPVVGIDPGEVNQLPTYDGPLYTLPILPVITPQEPEQDETPLSSELLMDWELEGIETFSLSPVTPADATGLKKVLLEVLGSYDNVVTQFRYIQEGSTRYTYVNEITPDYPWIFSAILFIVLIASVFRIFRSVLWKQ